MAITATVRATKALEKVPLDITLRMTVEEWRELQKMIPETWPGWDVSSAIGKALNMVEKSVTAIVEEGVEAK